MVLPLSLNVHNDLLIFAAEVDDLSPAPYSLGGHLALTEA
jgi:hypothetical protein